MSSASAGLALALTTRCGVFPDPWGRPFATDFASFWTAAKLAWEGTPQSAWNPAAHGLAQLATFPPEAGYADAYYAFFYPPTFLLLLLPLGAVSYGAAVLAWLIATAAAYVLAMIALLGRRWWVVLTCLSYPAFTLNAGHGQNGALSAALLGAAAALMDRSPRKAGVCLGMLCFKPQLALLVVPTLLVARRGRTLLWAIATALCCCLASLGVFGADAWRAFFHSNVAAATVLQDGLVGFAKMASPFAASRLLGLSVPEAWLIQGLVSAFAVCIVCAACRSRLEHHPTNWRQPSDKDARKNKELELSSDPPRSEKALDGGGVVAVLTAAACLATPFLLDYDLLVLAVPLAWLTSRALPDGWLPWEKTIVAMVFLTPLFNRPVALAAGIPLAPLAAALLLAAVVRRITATAPAGSPIAANAHPGFA